MGGGDITQQLLTSSDLFNSSQTMSVKLLFHTTICYTYRKHLFKKSSFRNDLDNLENVLFGAVSGMHVSVKLVTYQGICRAEEKVIRLSEN